VQVEQNVQAFRYGRLWVLDPERVRALTEPPRRGYEEERHFALERLRGPARRAYAALLERCGGLDEEARRLLAVRIAELIEYQDARYAGRYVRDVLRVAERERAVSGQGELTRAVIRNLFKLMAYKDEYEVARLHLKPEHRQATRELFSEPEGVSYHLHPPMLRALGLKRKLRLGEWFDPALKAMRAAKRLRGTGLDPFGYAAVRREERALIGWYRGLVGETLERLAPERYWVALEIAELPDVIRGYEEIKLRSVARARERAGELVRRLREPGAVRLVELEMA
jgi:indolepyruvate ferredoxin oxidoreductase